MDKWVIVFGAHPDDAEFGMAMRIAHLASSGFRVHVHCFSQGAERDRALRVQESFEAGRILGVAEYTFSALDENHLSAATREINDIAHELITAKAPRAVFTHFPDDLHPDHVAVGRGVTQVAKRDVALIEHFRSPYTENFSANRVVMADAELVELRRRALACFKSQSQLPLRALDAATVHAHDLALHHRVVGQFPGAGGAELFRVVQEARYVDRAHLACAPGLCASSGPAELVATTSGDGAGSVPE